MDAPRDRAARGVGLLLLGLGLYQVLAKVRAGIPHDIFWCCHTGELLLALGLLGGSARATALGTFWLTYGLPMWLLGLSGGEPFTVPSMAMHLGGLAGGVWGARRLGVPPGCWWQGVLGLWALKLTTRALTPAAANVNLAFAIYPGWEAPFRGSYAAYTLLLSAFGLGLFALEERLLRAGSRRGGERSSRPRGGGRVHALRELTFALGLARGRPFQVLVQLTNRCNLRCSFCDFWPNGAPPEQELSLAEHQRLADELRGLGRFIVSLEGGEPLLRPDLVEVVRAYARHHLPTLFTNGWFVTPEGARALFAAGLTQVGVSIDYPDAARHDAKRDLPGVTARAWRAVETLRDLAPHGGRQVHVMTVVMESNWRELEPLLQQSAARGVGHCVTLLSTGGHRRGQGGPDRLPPPEAARRLLRLWRRYPHLRFFSDYLRGMEKFLQGERPGTCRAGVQSFNVDHLGNVSPCIEKIDRPRGNLRQEPLAAIHARMSADRAEVSACNQCFTACRGFVQAIGGGGTLPAWTDLGARMRSR